MPDAWSCPTCGFRLYLPVDAPSLRATRLGLYSDARFPGRAILVFNRHAEHLEDLDAADLHDLWSDVASLGRILRPLVGAARINYAVLGNANQHLHVHVIPRDPAREPLPTRPPWSDPRPMTELPAAVTERLRGQLQAALNQPRAT